jgi:serine/threonine protein phosphatase 1
MTEKYIAIGDIHGQYDSLKAVTDFLKENFSDYSLVFLGDYVDRGPDSASVIEHILQLKNNNYFKKVFTLSGNHEQFFLNVIEKPYSEFSQLWAENFGGYQTLFSYGWEIDEPENLSMIPDKHKKFLQELIFSLESEHYFFCHAGVNPFYDLSEQDPRELISIREKFLNETSIVYDKIIVHGHTPKDINDVKIDGNNRLNIDTGAAYQNCITAVILDSEIKIVHAENGILTRTPSTDYKSNFNY